MGTGGGARHMSSHRASGKDHSPSSIQVRRLLLPGGSRQAGLAGAGGRGPGDHTGAWAMRTSASLKNQRIFLLEIQMLPLTAVEPREAKSCHKGEEIQLHE